MVWRPMKTENNYTTFIDHLLAEKKKKEKVLFFGGNIFLIHILQQ